MEFSTFLNFLIVFVIGASAFSIILAVFIDFLGFHPRKNQKKEKKSFVETGTMFLFFFLFYFVIRFNIGIFVIPVSIPRVISIFICLIIVVLGTLFNIYGRFYLGKNWSNQIKIYRDHSLVRTGPYAIVRHPLYASLIWIFYACSIIYLNWLAFLLNTVVFLPMMYYRAKQEEKLLLEQFKNYKNYKKEVGMFFPKW